MIDEGSTSRRSARSSRRARSSRTAAASFRCRRLASGGSAGRRSKRSSPPSRNPVPGITRSRARAAAVSSFPETRAYEFGDNPTAIDGVRTIGNAVRRDAEEIALKPEDFEVHEEEHLTSCATVLAIDISHSMILYGEDRFTPAKKVALALVELIQSKYPKDSIDVLLFGDDAKRVPISEISKTMVGPYHTNTRAGLALARKLLVHRKNPNKQIFLITDGKPSAIWERGRLYKNPFGLDLKIVNRTRGGRRVPPRRHHDHDLHDRDGQLPGRVRRQADEDQPRPGLLRLALQPGRVPLHRLHPRTARSSSTEPVVDRARHSRRRGAARCRLLGSAPAPAAPRAGPTRRAAPRSRARTARPSDAGGKGRRPVAAPSRSSRPLG